MRHRVEPFEASHLARIVANQLGQRELAWHDRRRLERGLGEAVRGLTIFNASSGEILCCGGISEAHPQYARLWAVYAEGLALHDWAFLLDRTRHFIAGQPHRRIDTLVDLSAPMALRWAGRIGLRQEGVMEAAAPDGGDMAIMARVER